jgi:hypothetical protein
VLTGGFSGGHQRAPGALGEFRHAHHVQHLVDGAQLCPGVDPAVLPTQPVSVGQVRAG